ncbi:hypothetical protein [Streptomyces sp. 021-4]
MADQRGTQRDEALVIATLLGQAAHNDWLVEDLAIQLAERMESRLA